MKSGSCFINHTLYCLILAQFHQSFVRFPILRVGGEGPPFINVIDWVLCWWHSFGVGLVPPSYFLVLCLNLTKICLIQKKKKKKLRFVSP